MSEVRRRRRRLNSFLPFPFPPPPSEVVIKTKVHPRQINTELKLRLAHTRSFPSCIASLLRILMFVSRQALIFCGARGACFELDWPINREDRSDLARGSFSAIDVKPGMSESSQVEDIRLCIISVSRPSLAWPHS